MAIEQADWLGVHAYWQTDPDGRSSMFDPRFGLTFRHYHEEFPDKPIEITEFGNMNVVSDAPIPDEKIAQEYVDYYTELFNYPYVRSANAFIMSSPDPVWSGVTWRTEHNYIKPVVNRVGSMERPLLVEYKVPAPAPR